MKFSVVDEYADTKPKKSKDEIQLYLDFPTTIGVDANLLDWWKAYGSQFPHFQQLALCLLPIPAFQSTPSERLFSADNWTLGDRRQSLSSDSMNSLMLVKSFLFLFLSANSLLEYLYRLILTIYISN